MTITPTIMEDDRPIRGIWFEDGGEYNTKGGFTIRPYQENGEMAPVVWFAVYKGDFLHTRVPGRMVGVTYEEG